MKLVNEGVLPPDELDDRDERREEQERARRRETFAEIERHYNRAKERHPYFCDRLFSTWAGCNIKELTRRTLDDIRARIKDGGRYGNLMWSEILDCEVCEVTDAIVNGDTEAAVNECYDCIAVLLRTIDVLEGRQKLGREGGAQ